MKIHIKSNFVVPGLEDKESVDINGPEISVRAFLEKLSTMSPQGLKYVEPGADRLEADYWEIDINDIPYQNHEKGLERLLKDGDTVTIKIMALGGG
jgi:hypothetical protein